MNSPHLQIQLAELGFAEYADALDKANSGAEHIRAVTAAMDAVEGYLLALRRHSRALRHTAAEYEREMVSYVAGALKARREELERIFGGR